MKPSICIDALFFDSDIPLRSQIEIVKKAGFSTIEFWTWWDKDLDTLQGACEEFQVDIHCMCTKFVSLVDPACKQSYKEGLSETLQVAKRLSCRNIITQVGNRLDTLSEEQQCKQAVDTLKEVADSVAEAGCTLLVEPLNIRIDHAGYFLDTTDRAVSLIEQVDHPSIKLLFDIYHQQISEGDLLRHIKQSSHVIGHFHAADNPGRDRPGTGEINYHFLLLQLDKLFKDSVLLGLEYFPKEDVSLGLSKMASLLQGAHA